MASVISVLLSVNPCLIYRFYFIIHFLLNMLYDYSIIFDYIIEGK